MEIHETTKEEKEAVLAIYEEAKAYFKAKGIDQWQNGYPDIDSLESDCEKGISYTASEQGKVIATFAVAVEKEKAYDAIFGGSWLSTAEEYGVIHRIAVTAEEKGKGVAAGLFFWAESYCMARGAAWLRIDTHRENYSMQRLLEKQGYQKCGTIYLQDGAERIAYEKSLYREEEAERKKGNDGNVHKDNR